MTAGVKVFGRVWRLLAFAIMAVVMMTILMVLGGDPKAC